MTVSAADLPLRQGTTAYTTAWHGAYGRRQPAESANSALKGTFVNTDKGFCRMFGAAKTALMLGFAISGYNSSVVRPGASCKRS
jgi:hypothetical protein